MRLHLIGLALLMFGCKGKDSAIDPGSDDSVSCSEPSPVLMRRLSRTQYANTVWATVDLLGGQTLTLDLADVLSPRLDALPTDSTDAGLSREDQAVTQAHADAWYLVAELVADRAIDPVHFDTVFDGCRDAECVDDFVAAVIPRLHRRDLSADELDFYVDDVYGSAPTHTDGLRDVVLVAMASPYYAHLVEHGSTEEGDLVQLTAYELANRLSYHFWSAPPDDALWSLAVDGSLLDDVVFTTQVARVFADPQTDDSLDSFFSEWLEIYQVAPMSSLVGSPKFDAFRAGFTPSPQLTSDMQQDALDLIRWHIQHDGTLDDLWTSDLNTIPSAELAEIYGASPWDGSSTPQRLDDGVHAGLLTRPAFTASGLPSTRPIHKGVMIRKRVLCDQLGSPPADIGEEPDVDPLTSTRERTEALTQIPGTSCAGCHEYINGLGFATENFDGLGRHRTTEPIFAEDGSHLGDTPVVTQGMPRVELEAEDILTDAIALADALAASTKTDTCVARYWFRQAYGHTEDLVADRCALESVSDVLTAGRPLADGLREIALHPAFKLRKFDASAVGGAL